MPQPRPALGSATDAGMRASDPVRRAWDPRAAAARSGSEAAREGTWLRPVSGRSVPAITPAAETASWAPIVELAEHVRRIGDRARLGEGPQARHAVTGHAEAEEETATELVASSAWVVARRDGGDIRVVRAGARGVAPTRATVASPTVARCPFEHAAAAAEARARPAVVRPYIDRAGDRVEAKVFELPRRESSTRPVEPPLAPPPAPQEGALRRAVDGFALLGRYHRLEVRGLDEIPNGPAILVGNHNGGLNPVDGLFLVHYYRARGYAAPIYVLGHDLLFRVPRLARVLESIGVVAADPTMAARILASGHKLLVFPGGDVENMRPFTARGRIDLAGRRGFLRLAQRTGVPLVPVVSAGAHETCVILSQGRGLARALGLPQRARVHSIPVLLAAPWGLLAGPTCALPYLPLPAKVTVEIGPAVAAPSDARDATLTAAYVDLEGRMQGTLDRLYGERGARRAWTLRA